ncbi:MULTISPECIES: hypothetical protein [Microbacterium]|uniref:Uncharacterized protein n=1 Tax=Microbacterium hydrocarbonoxydans TaxID=273678 RepID=A0A1H4QRR2_9MICO|nr:hypothetical protein [Microbacterium hydrocarbonoxydans]SEC22370.1 hypothetical protein SAMN04489807_3183 [Microbacterium hydrocarbonoxydans]
MSGLHTYETADIRGLESALKQLHGYCSELQAHAASATGAVSAQWSGIANTEFVNCVQTWQVGATILTSYAEYLATWAGDAATQYESAQSSVGSMWGGGGGGAGGGGGSTAV